MFTKLLYHFDFNNLEARNMVIANLASAPATAPGKVYYDTTANALRVWNGTSWGLQATDSALLNGQNAAFYLSRANHTGTQTASTISDLATTVQSYRLDQFAVPTAAVSFNSQKITSLADPTNPQDAATKNYVDTQVSNAAAGIDSKPSVKAVAVANVTLSGTQTIDGVALGAGDRVLLTAQTTGSQNGVYVVAAGAWSRATDADATGEITPGATWYVEQGTTYGASTWRVATTGTITLGSTSISITQLSSSISYTASLGVQLVGNDIRAQVVAAGGIQAVAGGLQIDTTKVSRGFAATIGTGSSATATVTHNLGTKRVLVSIRDVGTDEFVGMKVVATDNNTVTLTAAANISLNGYEVTVLAIG